MASIGHFGVHHLTLPPPPPQCEQCEQMMRIGEGDEDDTVSVHIHTV